MSEITVHDHLQENRYEARDGANLAGILEYELLPDAIIYVHTETDPAYEGQGVGSKLARFALDDARARGLAIVLECPFMRHYVRNHPEYKDLVRDLG